MLHLREPAPKGNKYKELRWTKVAGKFTSRIVFYSELDEGFEIQYYDDYCEGSDKCGQSSKGDIKIETGALIIYNVSFDDEAFYYYTFWVDDDVPDTGNKYEIYLEVYGKSSAIPISVGFV